MSLSYDDLTQPLQNLGVEFSASFSHGLLFALNCSNQKREQLAALFIELIADASASEESEHAVLIDLIEQVFAELNDTLRDAPFSFEPILDKTDIISESESIKDWTNGFILGLQQTKLHIKKYSDNTAEFLQDIKSIAMMPTLDAADQSSATDLMEIEEYLRMGAIGLYFDAQLT